MSIKQISENISKKLLEWDFEKAITNSNNEAISVIDKIDFIVVFFINI